MHSTEQPKTMTEPELNTNDKVYTPYQKDGKTQLPNIRVNDPEEKKFYLQANKNEYKGGILKNILDIYNRNKENIGELQKKYLDYNFMKPIKNKMGDIEKNITNDLEDKFAYYSNSSTDYSKPMTGYEKTLDFLRENFVKYIYPMSSDSVKDGLYDMEAAKANPEATIHDSIANLKDEKLKMKLKELKIPENVKGIEYSTNSKESRQLSSSPEINMYIFKKYYMNSDNPNDNQIDFSSYINSPNYTNEKQDNHTYIQHATIYNPQVDDNGIFTCKLLDYSDFAKRNINSVIDIVNDLGYNLQEKGTYKNYFRIINIRRRV